MACNANDPAYPFPVLHDRSAPTGLTKREAFAMAAMQGIVANPTGEPKDDQPLELFPTVVARFAIRIADALLAELAKEPA